MKNIERKNEIRKSRMKLVWFESQNSKETCYGISKQMIENKFMKTKDFYIKSITPGVVRLPRSPAAFFSLMGLTFDPKAATDLDNDCQRQDKLTIRREALFTQIELM